MPQLPGLCRLRLLTTCLRCSFSHSVVPYPLFVCKHVTMVFFVHSSQITLAIFSWVYSIQLYRFCDCGACVVILKPVHHHSITMSPHTSSNIYFFDYITTLPTSAHHINHPLSYAPQMNPLLTKECHKNTQITDSVHSFLTCKMTELVKQHGRLVMQVQRKFNAVRENSMNDARADMREIVTETIRGIELQLNEPPAAS